MNIQENNKLIAEFMVPEKVKNSMTNKKSYFTTPGFRYHDSWDWLMPVWRKIVDMRDTSTLLLNAKHLFKDIKHGLYIADEKVTYKAVIEFIKWYNLNK